MSYRVEAATKEEWAAKCFSAESKLSTAEARVAKLQALLVEVLMLDDTPTTAMTEQKIIDDIREALKKE
jgi:hypothetical protein